MDGTHQLVDDPPALLFPLALPPLLLLDVPPPLALPPLALAALASLEVVLVPRAALLVVLDRLAVLQLVRADLGLGRREVGPDRVDERERDRLELLEVVVVRLERAEVLGELVEAAGGCWRGGVRANGGSRGRMSREVRSRREGRRVSYAVPRCAPALDGERGKEEGEGRRRTSWRCVS